jgi:hypothetical protein
VELPAPQFEMLGALEQVRQRPAMFFGTGKANAEELLEAVLRDVRGRTQSHTLLEEGRFHLVAADVDWLETPDAGVMDLFHRFVVPTPMVPNSHRAEVLLNAVSEGVITEGPAGNFARALALRDLPERLWAEARRATRFLAWRF